MSTIKNKGFIKQTFSTGAKTLRIVDNYMSIAEMDSYVDKAEMRNEVVTRLVALGHTKANATAIASAF